MTEQQPYRVVSRHPGFELRRYPAHLVAEMQIQASFTRAPIEAFRPLAAYLGGANRARHPIGSATPATVRGQRLGEDRHDRAGGAGGG